MPPLPWIRAVAIAGVALPAVAFADRPTADPTADPHAPGCTEMSPAARTQYDETYLDVVDEVWHGRHSIRRVPQAYQGKYREPIDDVDFFRLVGRPDYADTMAARRTWGVQAMIAGGVLVAGSLTYVVVEAAHSSCDEARSGSCGRGFSTRQILPALLGVTLGAGAIATGGALTNWRPATAPEMRRLAAEYNQQLRARLEQTPPASDAKPKPALRAMQWQAAPYASADGGGLLLSGSF